MRSPWVLVSIVSHSLAIAAAAIAPLVASVDLPAVHSPLPAYMAVVAKDIPLPPPPLRRGPVPSHANRNAVPTEGPQGIHEEPVQSAIERGALEAEGGLERLDEIPGTVVHEVIRAPEPPREQAPVRVSEGIKAPRKIVDVAPVYPPIALSARKEGTVVLDAIIDPQGRVTNVRVVWSTPLFEKAALEAVRQWRFTPTLLNGQAVSVIMTVTVNFKLGR